MEETPETAVKYDNLEGDYSHVPPTPKWSARPMKYSIQFPRSNNEAFNYQYWELVLQRGGPERCFTPTLLCLPKPSHQRQHRLLRLIWKSETWNTRDSHQPHDQLAHILWLLTNRKWCIITTGIILVWVCICRGGETVDILISVSGGSFSECCRTRHVPCIFTGCWPIKVVVPDL